MPAVGGERRGQWQPASRHQLHRVHLFRVQQHQPVAVAPIARGPVHGQDGLLAGGAGPGLRRDGFRPERGLGAVRRPHDHRVGRGSPLGQIGKGSTLERLRPHLQTAALRDARGFAGFERQAPNVEVAFGCGAEVERFPIGCPRGVEDDGLVLEEEGFLAGRDVERPDPEPFGVIPQEREPGAVRVPGGTAIDFAAAGHPPGHPGLGVQQPDPPARRNGDGLSIRGRCGVGGARDQDGEFETLHVDMVVVARQLRIAVRPLGRNGPRNESEKRGKDSQSHRITSAVWITQRVSGASARQPGHR